MEKGILKESDKDNGEETALKHHSKKGSDSHLGDQNPGYKQTKQEELAAKHDVENGNFGKSVNQIKKTMTTRELIEQGEQFFDPKRPFFSLEMAMKHTQATRVYKEVIVQQAISTAGFKLDDICPCCSSILQSEDDQIPLLSDPIKEMAHLGPAYPLYFQFMRYSICFIGIILAIPGVYSLVINQKGNQCLRDLSDEGSGKSGCSSSFITELATTNRHISNPDEIHSILNLVAIFVMIIFSISYRVRQKQVQKQIDKSDVSVQDFTVFVNKIPHNKTKEDIKEFFESKVNRVKVEKVILAYKLKEYNSLNAKLSGNYSAQQKKQFYQQMEEYENNCSQEKNLNQTFAGAAFISFENEQQAIDVVQHFARPFWKIILGKREQDSQKLFDGSTLFVKQAQEPGDTNWEKIEISTNSKIIRRVITTILTLLFLGGSFWAIFFISYAQNNLNTSNTDKTTISILAFLGSLVIIFINQLFKFLINRFADFDGYNFKTDRVINVAKKCGSVQFVNTTMVQFTVNLILNGSNLATAGGLVNDITLLMLTNSILPVLIGLLHIDFIFKFIRQKLFLWKSKAKQEQLTQMIVHKLFERPTMDIASCFASAANALIFAAFYAYIIPLGLPLCMVYLFLSFYANKFKLLRTQSQPPPLGAELPAEMIDFYYELIILVYAAGCFTFELIIYQTTLPYTIAMLSIAAVFYLLPINDYIDAKLSDGSNFIEKMSYQEAKERGHFSTDYDRCNPVLVIESIKEGIDHILNKEKDLTKKDALLKIFYPKLTTLKQEKIEKQNIELKMEDISSGQNANNLPKTTYQKKLEPTSKVAPI